MDQGASEAIKEGKIFDQIHINSLLLMETLIHVKRRIVGRSKYDFLTLGKHHWFHTSGRHHWFNRNKLYFGQLPLQKTGGFDKPILLIP